MATTLNNSASTTTVSNDIDKDVLLAVSYIPLVIIGVGVTGNAIALWVFNGTKDMRKMSSMVYLSFIAISDTCGLFTWNLNHFMIPNGFGNVESKSVFTCRFMEFIQYLSLQCSGLLYSMVSIDRFFTIIAIPGSFAAKLPFGSRKSAFIWCTSIVICLCIMNSHILYMQGYMETVIENVTQTVSYGYNSTTIMYATKKYEKVVCFRSADGQYVLSPMWDYVNLALYNFIPFGLMVVFNTLLIVKTIHRKSKLNNTKTQDKQTIAANKRKRRLTISLFIITISFILMTFPGNILYAFFFDQLIASAVGHAVLIAADCFLFAQHGMLFFMCYFTNTYFRRIVNGTMRRICCCCCKKQPTQKTTTQAKTFSTAGAD